MHGGCHLHLLLRHAPQVSPEVLKKAGSPSFTTKEEGTGLGLYLSRSVLSEHQGTLSFESAPGKGTTVSVLFTPSSNAK